MVIRVDTALFAAAQAGDPVALERMLRELQPDIRRYAWRQCHRATAIEDVVQEALIVLYRRLGNVRDPMAIAGWIFRVVTRLCLLPVLGLIRGAEELTERHEAKYFARVPNNDLRIDLVRALESLPDIYREVILLRDMEPSPRPPIACISLAKHARAVFIAVEPFCASTCKAMSREEERNEAIP